MVSTRRGFLKSAGLAGVAAAAGTTGAAATGGSQVATGAHARSVQTDVLDIPGLATRKAAIALAFPSSCFTDFPTDVRAWDETVPPLAEAGYGNRVLVPYLRTLSSGLWADPVPGFVRAAHG